jgi:hypothetical protein
MRKLTRTRVRVANFSVSTADVARSLMLDAGVQFRSRNTEEMFKWVNQFEDMGVTTIV